MSQIKRFGLVVDNPSRDLKGLVLTARELVKQGHVAFLIPMYSQGVDVPLLGLDGVVINYAREVNRPLLEAYKKIGIDIIVLDTEGGVVSKDGADSPANWAKRMKDHGFSKLVDHYLFWGSEIHQAFVQFSGLASDRLEVTGCPRYDLVATKFRNSLGYPFSGHVLLNTNFSAINPNFSQSEEEEIRAFLKSGWDRDYVVELLRDWRAVMSEVLMVFERLLKARPEETFVLRPHPFENPEFYRKRFENFSNLKVVTEGDVFQAIANCKVVLHLNCGTAIESLLMGKLPVNLEFLNTDIQRDHTPLPRLLSINAKSWEDLVTVLDAPSKHQSELEEKIESFIRPWFGDVDGGASRRVADYLIRYVERGAGRRRSLKYSLRSGRLKATKASIIQGVLGNAFGSSLLTSIREWLHPERKSKSFSASGISALVKQFEELDPLGIEIQVKAAGHPMTGVALSSIQLQPR